MTVRGRMTRLTIRWCKFKVKHSSASYSNMCSKHFGPAWFRVRLYWIASDVEIDRLFSRKVSVSWLTRGGVRQSSGFIAYSHAKRICDELKRVHPEQHETLTIVEQ